MHRPYLTFCIALLLATTLPLLAQQPASRLPGYDTVWTGLWKGALIDTKGAATPVMLDVTAIERGVADAVYSLPDQLTYNRPFDTVVRQGDSLHCESAEDNVRLTAVLDASRQMLSGTWTTSASVRTFRLVRSNADARPQEQAARQSSVVRLDFPLSYPADRVDLAAELMLPPTASKKQRAPLVVFISDVGDHDRDGSHHDHRPYLVMAEHLARAGWASVRWDDRGVGGSTGTLLVAGTSELAAEVDHVIRSVGSYPGIDTSRVVLVASGEGGMVAAAVAARRRVKHLILLGTPMVDGLSVLRDAFLADEAESGTPEHVRTTYSHMITQWMTAIRLRPDPVGSTNAIAAIADSIYVATGKDLTTYPALRRLVDSTRRSYILGAILPWLQRYESLNPQAALRPFSNITTLMLAENDPVVPIQKNAEAYQVMAGKPPVVISQANHYFQRCVVCTSAEAGDLANTVAEDLLAELVRTLTRVAK